MPRLGLRPAGDRGGDLGDPGAGMRVARGLLARSGLLGLHLNGRAIGGLDHLDGFLRWHSWHRHDRRTVGYRDSVQHCGRGLYRDKLRLARGVRNRNLVPNKVGLHQNYDIVVLAHVVGEGCGESRPEDRIPHGPGATRSVLLVVELLSLVSDRGRIDELHQHAWRERSVLDTGRTRALSWPNFLICPKSRFANSLMLPLAISRRLTVSHRAATLFRSSLASVVLLELYERLEINHWLYTDDGAFPRWAVMPPADVAPTLHWLCLHAWDGGHQWTAGLAALQGVVALFLLCGALPPPYKPHERWLRMAAAICWALQLSLMLRNPQLVFILDRYMHILLLLAACMPSGSRAGAGRCSAASCARTLTLNPNP